LIDLQEAAEIAPGLANGLAGRTFEPGSAVSL
jgi:hypothetical protein